MSALDILVPETRRLNVGGREVDVEVLRMRQIPGFSRAIAQPWPLIVDGDYLAAVVQFAEDIMQAVHLATGQDREFLDGLRPDEFLDLATAVFEVNLDFFARAVLPAAKKMGAALNSVSSPASSRPGTATPTSLN